MKGGSERNADENLRKGKKLVNTRISIYIYIYIYIN